MAVRSVVLGVGSALPRRRVDNAELAQTVDTTDQWIVERTGIRTRYLAGEGETTASLARVRCSDIRTWVAGSTNLLNRTQTMRRFATCG